MLKAWIPILVLVIQLIIGAQRMSLAFAKLPFLASVAVAPYLRLLSLASCAVYPARGLQLNLPGYNHLLLVIIAMTSFGCSVAASGEIKFSVFGFGCQVGAVIVSLAFPSLSPSKSHLLLLEIAKQSHTG